MNLLAIVPWYYRWGAVVLLLVAAAGFGAAKMHEHDQAKFDAFEAKVKAAGDRQNELTQQIITSHKQLQELSDAEARTRTAERDLALSRLRQSASARVSIVPAKPPGSNGSDRICFAREILDRELRGTVARAAERLIGISQEGQRGVDVASLCRDWAKKL